MRGLLLVLLFAARVAEATSTCPTMSKVNTYVTFYGTLSGCSAVGPQMPCAPGEIVQFTVASFGYSFACAVHRFDWTFGDGTQASGQQPAHTFVQNGIYKVAVTITTAEQTLRLETELVVTGICECPPFMILPRFVNGRRVALAYTFHVIAAQGTGDWVWDFGDGTILRTALREIEHTYARGGLYVVRLSSTGSEAVYDSGITVPPTRRRSAGH